jgi:restriction endonuclease S subunit
VTLNQELLGKHVKVVGGFAFKSEQFSEKGIPVIRISDIQGGIVSIEKAAQIPKANIGKGESYCIQAGDILVAMSGATTGKIGLVPNNFNGLVLQNQRVGNFKITSPEKLHKSYLKHYVNSPFYQGKILNTMAGAAQPNISSKQLENIEIPLPPLPEQVRIAVILDHADALRVKRREALAQLDSLTQSIFIEMFGDPNENEKNWNTVKVDELCELVRGSSPRPQGDPRYFGGSVPRLMVADITRDGWLVTPRIDSLTEEGAKRSRPVIAGTVVMAVSGNIGLVSRLAVDACVHDGFVAFKNLDEGKVTPQFFLALLHHSKPALEKHKAGAIFINLTTTDIKSLRLITPPLVLQQEFNCRLTAVEKLKAAHRESLVQLDNLFSTLQHNAFRGEL